MAGVTKLERLLGSSPDAGLGPLQERIAEALRRVSPLAADCAPELDFWAMIQADWQREDKLAQPADYAAATAHHLDKTRALVSDLRPGDAAVAELEQLGTLAARPDTSLDERRAIYLRTRWLKRQVLLSNPRMQFGQLLFAKRVPTSYSHLVMQYFGWRARPGGGLFVLDKPGRSLAARDLLDGKLAGGNVLEPRLSYDAQRIIFSFSKCTPGRSVLPHLRSADRRHELAAADRRRVRGLDAQLLAGRRDRLQFDAPQGPCPLLRRPVRPALARLHAAPHGRRRVEHPHLVVP